MFAGVASFEESTKGLAARRGAGGILSGDVVRLKERALSKTGGLNQETDERQQTGSGLRPLRCAGTAATIVVLTTVINRMKRSLG